MHVCYFYMYEYKIGAPIGTGTGASATCIILLVAVPNYACVSMTVLPLATIFPNGLGRVRVVKVDTQGCACYSSPLCLHLSC